MVDDKENGLVGASSSSSAFGEGKIRIKLKIPKHEEEDEENGLVDEDINNNHEFASQEKDHPEENNSNAKICQVCNKVFNSGKALGGHMRIHFQAYKELMISKKKLIKLKVKRPIKLRKQKEEVSTLAKNKINVDKSDYKKPKCVECGKSFPSMKSLFGHMRCHPERDWRGIEPPPAAKNSSPTSSVSDVEPEETDDDQIGLGGGVASEDASKVDLVESLPGWSVTAKRGRKTISGSSEEELQDAARSILLLAADGDPMETTNSNSLTDADRVNELKRARIGLANGFSNDDHVPKMPRCSTNGMVDVEKGKSGVESDSSSSEDSDSKDSEKLADLIRNKKRRKKMKLRDLEQMKDIASPTHQTPVMITASTTPPPPPDQKYRCSTCGKSFPTHQALGGHRSSHNKLKIVIQNSIDESNNSSAAAVEDDHKLANAIIVPPVEENKESEGAVSSKLVMEGTHQCNICNKNFQSGQALGGHKRCHWSGVMSPGEVSQTGRRMLDFDLNEAPPMEYEEANADYGYGYASSSCI